MRRASILAGIGAIAFSVFTVAAFVVSAPPGGDYSASDVGAYVAPGHLVAVLVALSLALLGVLGLICLLAHLREAISSTPNSQLVSSIFWATGIAAATSFAVGWGLIAGQPIAHAEGGARITIALPLTYLISEVGVVIIFGPGAMLMGFALIALMLGSRGTLPAWLRWVTLAVGAIGLTSLAYFSSFVLIVWGIVIGVWLLIAGREDETMVVASQPEP
jgi:hypothetical protein